MNLYSSAYSHLKNLEKKGNPYWDDVPKWQRAYMPLLYWLCSRQVAHAAQIGRLTLQYAAEIKKAALIKRQLLVYEKQGQVSFNEALQLSGLILAPEVLYPHEPDGVENQFFELADEVFSDLELLPPRIVAERYASRAPSVTEQGLA